MGTFRFTLLICSFFLLSNLVVHAQWVRTNGPHGGSISCLAVGPDRAGRTNLFAGSQNSVFHSTNGGISWTEVSTVVPFNQIRSLAVSPDSSGNLFAGTDDGIFRSTDNGTNWIRLGFKSKSILSIAHFGAMLFAGSTSGSIWFSTNNGTSWKWETLLTGYGVWAFAMVGENYFIGTGGGISRSKKINESLLWYEINNGLTSKSVKTLAVLDTNIFAGTEGGGVFLSTNKGANWSAVNNGLSNLGIRALAVIGTNLFAGTSTGVFISTDSGASWSSINTGLTNPGIRTFAVSSGNLFTGTDGGVFLSTNNGQSWNEANTGLTNTVVYALAEYPSRTGGANQLFAGSYGGGVYLSSNDGASWTSMNSGLINTHLLALTTNSANLFAGTEGRGVFRSTDSGKVWIEANNGLTNSYIGSLAVHPQSSGNLFAGTNTGVFRTTDNGTNWINTGGYGWILASMNTNLFAGGSEVVNLSTNNGASWTPAGFFNMVYLSSLAVSVTNLFAGTNQGVYLTTDKGINWTGASFAYGKVLSLLANGRSVFAGTTGGVSLSTDNGKSWIAINTGLVRTSVNSLIVSGSNLFAGTDNGVWRRPLSEITTSVEQLSIEVPVYFNLYQNYPNPFGAATLAGNLTTNIKFSVPQSGFVSLKVFNVFGELVSTLASEEFHPGNYSTRWDASDFTSGVYIYRLESGSFSETRKIILLR